MIYPILYYGEPILRRRARSVERFDGELERLAADMLETMYAADGVGLAAPQIGLDKRLFVALEVAQADPDEAGDGVGQESGEGEEAAASAGVGAAGGTVHDEHAGQLAPAVDGERAEGAAQDLGGTHDDEDEETPLTKEEKRRAWGVVREHVIVNPVMLTSSGRQLARDGCLSLPGLVAEGVPRPTHVELEYQDLTGARRRLSADGYFAHVLQHEFDHLEGVLYFDHLPPERRQAFLEEHRSLLAEWQRLARARAKSAEPARVRQTR